jgi:2-polyprenyl-3-methyl-5-hydroxy-6-metoxy-1,4-benzoquinol methylase
VDSLYDLPGKFSLYRCAECGLIQIYPPLPEDELHKYYPENYFAYETSRRVTPLKTFNEKLSFYLKHPLQGLNCLCYSKILGLNRALKCAPGCNVLDIGCGDGRFLLESRANGCLCFGNDISRTALNRLRQIAPDIETRCGNLWEVGFSGDFFDVINLSNVIEHVPDIDKLLFEARRIIKPDGRLRVQVPNSASLTFAIFGKNWLALDVPRHVHIFSMRNIKKDHRKLL